MSTVGSACDSIAERRTWGVGKGHGYCPQSQKNLADDQLSRDKQILEIGNKIINLQRSGDGEHEVVNN